MAGDVATLNLEVKSDSVKVANAALRDMPAAASAAERAAQKWGMTTSAAARSTEDFSRRVRKVLVDLEFERQQLTRNAAAQEFYAATKRAGVSASSAEGRAIAASIAALQAQRAALHANQTTAQEQAARTQAVFGSLRGTVVSLLAVFSAGALISKFTEALKEAADLEETADQIGVTTRGLQALQFAAAQNGISVDQLSTAIGKFSQNIGNAAEGEKSAIENLEKLGIKILDVKGNLLPTEDLLVEAAKKIMAIEDPAKRVAAAVDLFGKAGKAMLPLLAELAKGMDVLSDKAKNAGAIFSEDVGKKLDALADAAARAHLVIRAFFAENAAGPLTDLLQWLEGRLSNISRIIKSIREDWSALLAFAANPSAFVISGLGDTPSEALNKKIKAAQEELEKNQKKIATADSQRRKEAVELAVSRNKETLDALLRQRQVMDVSGKVIAPSGDPDNIGIVVDRPPKGVSMPPVKGSGSDPYAKAVESARDYIASKQAEAAAIGQTLEVASRMRHEQELINKATNDNKVLTAEQAANLKSLAAAMAEADNRLASNKFLDSMNRKTEDFIANQELERQSLFMNSQAADQARFAQELLNQAKADGLVITAELTAKIQTNAAAMAEAKAKTDNYREAVNFAKDTTKGFLNDLGNGLREGKNAWESFGNAASNVLNRIADKLVDMAVNNLFDAAFGGRGGGGSFGLFGGGGAGGTGSGIFDSIFSFFAGSPFMSRNGNVFMNGSVKKFARGGIFDSPTIFPMANGGVGMMGEAGPEAIMPLRRDQNGRLGVEARGGTGSPRGLNISISLDNDLLRAVVRDESGRVVAEATPEISEGTIRTLIDRRQSGKYREVFKG